MTGHSPQLRDDVPCRPTVEDGVLTFNLGAHHLICSCGVDWPCIDYLYWQQGSPSEVDE